MFFNFNISLSQNVILYILHCDITFSVSFNLELIMYKKKLHDLSPNAGICLEKNWGMCTKFSTL